MNSDGKDHEQRRKPVAHRMLPRSPHAIGGGVDEQAAQVVDAALGRSEIDGVADLASALPLAVVPDLVGWPRDQRDHLLAWGGATFDILGPFNRRWVTSFPSGVQMLRFARRVVRRRSVIEGSLEAILRALVDRVDRIELTSPPTWAINNIIRRFEYLPLKLIAA